MPTKLEQNRIYAQRLGWQPRDFGAAVNDFTSGLVAAIEAMQGILNVTVDGVAGPKTYVALLAARQRELIEANKSIVAGSSWCAQTQSDRLVNCGLIAMYELKMAWMRDGGIIDLPSPASGAYARCQKFIDDIIRTPLGICWTWEEPYHANTRGYGNFEWCGAAAAFAWRKAGLKMTIARDYFPSTYRLDRYARYRQINDHTPNVRPEAGPYRELVEFDEKSTPQTLELAFISPRPGDILMVGPVHSAYGKHITVVESFDPKTSYFTTLEGNGTGVGPDGARRHGVVRAQRPLGLAPGHMPTVYHARRLIRVAPSDVVS